jgi:hypothetical protein
MTRPGERIAENEALFREMNEPMAAWQERREAPTETHLYFCECGERSCYERVALTIADYEALRADPAHFRDGYLVAEKNEDVRPIVERMDPRSVPRDS